jgi:hypothetical protein
MEMVEESSLTDMVSINWAIVPFQGVSTTDEGLLQTTHFWALHSSLGMLSYFPPPLNVLINVFSFLGINLEIPFTSLILL